MLFFPRSTVWILLTGTVLVILVAGLYPFDYFPTNQVRLTDDGKGIRFYGSGVAGSSGDAAWPIGNYSGQSISLRLRLTPQRAYHRTVPHILSLCDAAGGEVFYLGQWKNHLVLRLMDEDRRSTSVRQERGTPDLLHTGKPVNLTFIFLKGRAELYAGSDLADVFNGFDLPAALTRRPVLSMILGNASTADEPWQGDISGFSVFIEEPYDGGAGSGSNSRPVDEGDSWREVINYRFDRITSGSIANTAGDRWLLKVPDRLVPLKREFLAISAANDFHKRWFYGDALVNFLGFIPLGFFLGFTLRAARSWTRLKIIAVTAGSGFWLSLLIELNQGFLITRSSSLTDLVLNSLGTLAGTCLLLNLPARHLPGKTA